MRLQRPSFGRQYRKQMVHVAGVPLTNRAHYCRQQLTIARRACAAPDRPLRQQRQACAKHGGLQIVETAVDTGFDVVPAFTLSAVAQLADARRDGVAAGDHRTPVAKRAEVLRRIEAERRSVSARADWNPALGGEVEI